MLSKKAVGVLVVRFEAICWQVQSAVGKGTATDTEFGVLMGERSGFIEAVRVVDGGLAGLLVDRMMEISEAGARERREEEAGG